jgi:hypothetical protein
LFLKGDKIMGDILVRLWYGWFMIGVVVTLLIFMYVVDPYKQGQVDALTGNVKYELVTQDDSTKVWKEIKK